MESGGQKADKRKKERIPLPSLPIRTPLLYFPASSLLSERAIITLEPSINSNLFPVNVRITKAWDSRDELRDMRVRRREGDRTRPR